MTESRDRLSRPEDVIATFARRRRAIRGFDIFSDESLEGSPVGTPFRWGTTPLTGVQGPVRVAAATGRGVVRRGSLGTPIRAFGRGRENVRPGSFRSGRGRGRGTFLPSWYPRAPLRDITAISRAIERRRRSLREIEGLQVGTPTPPQNQTVQDSSYAETTPNTQLEHIDFPATSPNLAAGKRPSPCPPSVAKILLRVTSQGEGEENCLTPQKKLLNSIDSVGRAVTEELEKMKKTPSAKRAIRDRKVRTLMSMR